jgi:ketosteroid isomerase-like protein
MSQENVEIVRRSFTTFTRGDTALFLELLDPDVEWIPLMAALEGRVLETVGLSEQDAHADS